MKGIPVLSSPSGRCGSIQSPSCLMSCSTSCFYVCRSAPLALQLDVMGYVEFKDKMGNPLMLPMLPGEQMYPPPAQPCSFHFSPVPSSLPVSSMPLQELYCASGSVPSYLKAGRGEDESSSCISSLWSSSPPLFL